MGYLDHSTNNIILDAVLTDFGRKTLASSGKLEITKFALGDDEIDYTVIKKYGRTVGKEKIEKNTPVFEALTNENIALKCKLIGSNNNSTLNTVRLPVLELRGSAPDLSSTNNRTQGTISFNLNYRGAIATPSSLSQDNLPPMTGYTVALSSRFLSLTGVDNATAPTGNVSSDANRTKTYAITVADPGSFSIKIASNPIDSTTLSIYGQKIDSTQRRITTYVTLTNELGISYSVPVTYTSTS